VSVGADCWMYQEERRQSMTGQRLPTALTRGGFSIDEMMPANGNKPITSLRRRRQILCESVKRLQLGRQHPSHRFMPPLRFLEIFKTSPNSGKGQRDRPGWPFCRPAKSPITGGLEGSVYTPKNELSIMLREALGPPSRPGRPGPQIHHEIPTLLSP
jgi:hypothetical protein